jgi:hypothetical protein
MDWLKPSEDKRVILGVIRLPAKTRTNYLGPVFLNPGVSLKPPSIAPLSGLLTFERGPGDLELNG